MLAHLSRSEERNENHKTQMNAFFDVLEERFLDINPYCRCRTIQVYVKLCETDIEDTEQSRLKVFSGCAVAHHDWNKS